MDNSTIWKLIDKYFTDNPQCLVRHHIESYNDFFKNGIFKIFKEKPPIVINTRFDKEINDYRSQCIIYLGGKDGSKIYFGKPVIYDDNNNHYMFPNEARLRNMSYGMTIHYDVDVEFIDILGKDETPKLVGLDELEEYSSSDDEDKNKKKKIVNIEGGKLTEEKIAELKKSKREQFEKELKHGGSLKIPLGKKRKSLELTPAESELLKKAIEESMTGGNIQKRTMTLEKIYLGKFPIMVQSDYCVLKDLPREVRHSMGECVNDLGGYFIIDGKEKTVVSQEKFADNMLYIRDVNDEHYLYSAEIRSVSENVSKPIRTLSVKIVTPSKSYSNKNIVVNIPNVRKPVPLFIVFRALGIISDKDIITTCLLDINKYDNMMDLFIPSVHDAGMIMTQRNALQYIAILTKGKTIAHTLEILSDYFLPHIGEVNFINKAYYLGYIVFRLLSVYTGLEPATDRDNFKYKRIELVGSLMSDLFREYYTLQQRQVQLSFEEIVHYNESIYADNLYGLIDKNYKEVFRERIVETGFKKAFKGNWGSQTHTKRIGIVQDLNRLSFNSALSHLRKTNLPLDASVKLIGPRVLHSTQWGMFDPIDTPDGGNIGIHKHISISAYITQGISREPFIQWLREKVGMKKIEDCSPLMLANMTKILLNGLWAGSISSNPIDVVKEIKLFRRNALIPIYVSVTFDIKQRTIFIYTDGGRICRPIFYRDDETGKMSFDNKDIVNKINNDNFSWNDLISGFNKKNDGFKPNDYKMYELNELYEGIDVEINPSKLERFKKNKAIIDYIDSSESEDALIAFSNELSDNENQRYTHMEIHESFIFGMMCNLINFPENNPATRNSFSCGQSKQACSMYHTNHQVRMDKTAVVLCSGQIPLVKSRYLEYINNEENPYGENAIVAIMCYTGYNVEDAILINEGALKRGLFRTTYYSTYESHEEKTKSGDVTIEKLFTNIENDETVNGKKSGYDYSKLDQFGIIRENTLVDDKTILIGLAANNAMNKSVKIDMSKTTKKGQLGIVDKTFITESEEGKRIAKVRVREERIPNIGDKMACALPTQQVLTNLGWVEIKEIDISIHKVATLDVNGNMCYEYPVNKFEYDHNGKMYFVQNKQTHVICTLNHKLYVKKRNSKRYELIEAENVMGKMVRFQKSMQNIFPDTEYIILGEKQYKMDDWLQLLGMFIGDGSVNNRAVVLSCYKERKVNFNISILTKLGIEYKYDKYNGYFAINKGKYKEIYDELKKYSIGALNKYLPDYVWTLSQRQSIILLESLLQSDGHTYNDGFSRYGTISLKLANDVSRLAIHCGWSGVIKIASVPNGTERFITGTMGYNEGKTHIIVQKHTYYKISIIRKQNQPFINKKVDDTNVEKLIDYNGKVYCIEMPSSHLYYMRENNFSPSMLIGNSRSGQKGTIGLVIPEDDMPFTKDGLRPDMIINPHAIPSRMTIGHLVECIIGKAAAHYGGFSDCTAFNNKGSKVGVFGEMLPKVGFHSSGNEILYNGMTGEQIESEIFIGPNYYMRLKHMVKDKINYRALGPRTALTKQPVAGRANDGGLRIGEMERDSVISHGAAEFLRESMMERGDKYYMAVCNKTGLLAIYNPSKNIFISPMADGPIKFVGSLTETDLRIDNITKYGRSFSVVCIPYTLKLLIQELQTINVQMRIITEDNIEQLENLSYSNNIDKLMFTKNIEPQEIVNEIKLTLRKSANNVNEYLSTPIYIQEKEKSPDYPDTSPAYQPSQEEEIIRDDDDSPPYNPFSENISGPRTPSMSPPRTPSMPPPRTPSMSPPEDFEQYSDFKENSDIITEQYSAGEEVFFRGDFLPNRIWKIKNVGDRFITITTDNIQGLDDKDTIKVVTKIDIYRPNDFTYTEPNAETIRNYNELAQTPNSMPRGGGIIQDGVPSINFAPVFKIMNGGNDFSNGEQQNENISTGRETKLNSITDLAVSSNPQINVKSNSEKSGGSNIEKQEPVDFSKLVIKKV
jgi:DNA-directed RNA polymerase beta subunit